MRYRVKRVRRAPRNLRVVVWNNPKYEHLWSGPNRRIHYPKSEIIHVSDREMRRSIQREGR